MSRELTEDRPLESYLTINVENDGGLVIHKQFPSGSNQSAQKIVLAPHDLPLLRVALGAPPNDTPQSKESQ